MAEREPTARDMYMANMLHELDNDPRTRARLHDLVAEKYPDHAELMPDVQMRRIIAPEIEALRTEREELRKEREQDARARNRQSFRDSLAEHGAKPSEYEALEKYAVEHRTADPKLIVMGYRAEHAVAQPSALVGPTFGSPIFPHSAHAGEFFSPPNGPKIGDDWRAWRSHRIAKDLADWQRGGEAALEQIA